MTDPVWYSVLPPLLAIALAIWSKQVIPSLAAGIWMGHTLLARFNPLAGLGGGLDGMINVFTDPGRYSGSRIHSVGRHPDCDDRTLRRRPGFRTIS